MIQSSTQASLVNLYSSEVICNLTEGSTLADFLHTCTLNCREKSDEFRELSKRMASECDVTSERYRTYRPTDRPTHPPTDLPANPPTHPPTYLPTYLPAYLHVCMHAYIHTYMDNYIHAYVHTFIHIYIATYTVMFINSPISLYSLLMPCFRLFRFS